VFQLPDNLNFSDFRQLANGVFQAEGHISCRIRPGVGNSFFPIFNLVQNYSEESLKFFLTLWNVLDKKCNLNVSLSSSGKLILTLSSESWSQLSLLRDYFSYCYGEKFVNFAKIADIRRLSLSGSLEELAKAAQLAYHLSAVGSPKSTKLEDVLTELKIADIKTIAPFPTYTDNQNLPSIIFIIGLLIGDGCLHIRLRKTHTGSINIIPKINFSQVSTEFNSHFMNQLKKVFDGLNIPVIIKNVGSSNILEIEGKTSVFMQLLPLLTPYAHLFYWKASRLKLFVLVSYFMSSGIHLTLKGISRIIDLCYSDPNIRTQPLDYWKNVALNHFNKVESELFSGHHLIWSVKSRGSDSDKEIVAWLVRSPLKNSLEGKLVFKSKQIGFKNQADKVTALQQAIAYRDSQITTIINTIEAEVKKHK
jgi:hypothetical protein